MFDIKDSGPDIPDGSYPAVLEKVESDRGKFGEMRKWHWLVELPASNGQEARIESFTQYSSANTGQQSISRKILQALLKKDLKAGETVDDPTGNSCILVFGRNDKGFPKVLDALPKVDPQQTIDGLPR